MLRDGRTLPFTATLLATLAFLLTLMGACLALSADIHWPEASGVEVYTQGSLTLDLSNAHSGYVMARAEPGSKRYKLRVSLGQMTLMYDLNNAGEYEIFPLQLGSGKYSFELFRNADGNRYSAEGSMNVNLELNDENAAFLLPNQYVAYDRDSEAVALSDEICAGCETTEQKLEAVRGYVVSNFSYDFDKAARITAGTLPSVDELLSTRRGICQDIAAFTACVLRLQGVPTQLVIGYADRNYHAWNNVLIGNEWVRVDLTAEVNSVYRDVTYTTERVY